MKISCLIPCHNEEHVLRMTLPSFINQDKRPFHEILVYDDASTDKSLDVLKEFSGKISYYHSDEHKGEGYGRHYLTSLATGDWLFYPGADDMVPPYFVEVMEKFEEPGYTVYYGDWAHVNGAEVNNYRLRQWTDAEIKNSIWGDNSIIPAPGLLMAATVAHRDLVLKAGGRDSDVKSGEDYAFALKAGVIGHWKHVPHVIYRYFIMGDNAFPGGLPDSYRDMSVKHAQEWIKSSDLQ